MKKLLSIAMAVCVIFAMISCDTGTSPSKGKQSEFTVKYNANGWTGGGLPASFKVKNGDAIDTTAIIPLDETDTQRFLGYSLTKGQDGAKVTADYVPTANITLYVLWQKLVADGEPVTIKYNANGWSGGNVPTAPATAKKSGEQIGADNIPDLSQYNSNGQIFVGWSETSGKSGTKLTATYTLRGDLTLYVLWTSPVTLSFDYNYDGHPQNPAPVNVGEGIPIGNVLPPVFDTDNPDPQGGPSTRQGYMFLGWFTESTAGTKVTATSSFTENKTIYAQWEKEPTWAWFNLGLDLMPASQPTPGNQWPAALAAAEFTPEGWLKWTFNDNNQRGIILLTPGQRRCFDKLDEFRLVIEGEVVDGNANGQFRFFFGNYEVGQDWNGTQAITAGVFSTQLENNVVFNNNKNKTGGDGAVGTEDTRTQAYILQYRTPSSTTTVLIKSIKIRYDSALSDPPTPAFKVKFDLNYTADPQPVPPNFKLAESGAEVGLLPVVSRDLYDFNGWYDAGTGGNKITAASVLTRDTDIQLYAQWTQLETVDLTYNLNYVSTDEPPAVKTVVKNREIGAAALPAITRVGYSLDGWFDANTGGNKITATSTFSANATLYAQWTESNKTVTFKKADDTVVKTVTVAANSSVGTTNWPADPTGETNWAFMGWYTTKTGGTEFKSDTTVTADITLYALFGYTGAAAWQEKYTMTNTAIPVYGFVLPDGATFGDYTSVKITWKFDTDTPLNNARLRAWGPWAQDWLADGNINTNKPAANAWNAAPPGGLLICTGGNQTYAKDEWRSDDGVDFNQANLLSDAAKAQTGLVLLSIAPIPNNTGEPSNGQRIYYVKGITLVHKDDPAKNVTPLHPCSSLLWKGTGSAVYMNQGAAADTLTREWSFVE